jgi:hypothetical protein
MGKLNINNGGVDTNKKMPDIDERFGPYSSIEAANAALGGMGRDTITAGLTVGILTANAGVKEYWYQPNEKGQLELVEKKGKKGDKGDPVDIAMELDDTDIAGAGTPSATIEEVTPAPEGYDQKFKITVSNLKGGKGDNGDKGDNAVSPFKGWLDSTSKLPANPHVGDYAYVESGGTTYVYRCATEGQWPQSSSEEKEPSDATFASAQLLNNVKIDDTHLSNPVGSDETNNPTLAKAEDVMQLNAKLRGITMEEDKVEVVMQDGKILGSTGLPETSSISKYCEVNIESGSTKVRFLGVLIRSNLTGDDANLGYSFGHYEDSNWVDDGHFNFSKNTENTNLLKEYVVNIPSNATAFRTTCKWGGVLVDTSFYCYFGKGESVLEIMPQTVDNLKTNDATKNLSAKQGYELNKKLYGYTDDSVIGEEVTLSNLGGSDYKDNGFNTDTSYNAFLVGGNIRSKYILNFATIKSNYKKLRITANSTYSSGYTFVKKTVPSSSTSFTNLVTGGYLCDIHTSSQAKVFISVPAGATVNVDIPDDAVGCYILCRKVTDGSSASATLRQPSSIVPFGVHVNGDIDDLSGKVTVDDIEPTEEVYLSDNICNPETCYFGNDKYINRSDGTVGTFTLSIIGGYTNFIPIDKKGLTFTNICYSGNVIGGAVYNANKQFIRNAGDTGIVAYQEGDAFVRFTLGSGANANNVMVNKGLTALPYVAYLGTKKVISREILPESSDDKTNYEDGVEVVIPNEIVITKGDSLQLFYRSIVKASNPFAYNVIAKATSGYPWPKYFELNTSYKDGSSLAYLSIGTRSLSVKVTDSASNEITSASSTIRIINTPSSPLSQKNILLVGASTFAGGQSIGEINRRLTTTDGVELTATNVDNRSYFANPKGLGLSNVSFVGRLTSNGVKHEAVSGRQMHSMVVAGSNSFYTFYFDVQQGYTFIQGDVYSDGTRQFTVIGSDSTNGDLQCNLTSGSGTPSSTGTLTLVSGSGTNSMNYTNLDIQNTNPFWNATTSSIDFARYSTNYLNNSDIDILVICLGINDMFGGNRTPKQIAADYKTFIRAYHTDFPNGKVILFTAVLPDFTGGMAASYKSSYIYWDMINKYFNLWKEEKELVIDEEFSDYVLLCSSASEFDNENLYAHKTVKTSNRSTVTYEQGTNALHYGEAGFKTVADSIYHYICYALNQFT